MKRIATGNAVASISSPSVKIVSRWNKFWSSRTLPGQGTFGFGARSGRSIDLLYAASTRPGSCAWRWNAVSVAGVLLLAEVTMTESEDEGACGRRPPESFE